jgi:hypothetical protein
MGRPALAWWWYLLGVVGGVGVGVVLGQGTGQEVVVHTWQAQGRAAVGQEGRLTHT